MKLKNNIIILLTIFTLSTTSCNKFLDMVPQDTRVVSTIEDYRDIMGSFMMWAKTPTSTTQPPLFGISYNTSPYFSIDNILAVYTDEAGLSKTETSYFDKELGDYTANGRQFMTWTNSRYPNYCWQRYYSFLGAINLILVNIDDADGDDEDLRNIIKGESLVWRAFSYYKLLQYFSPLENNDFGIPMYLDPTDDIGNAMPSRLTQKENFYQILSDCNLALTLLKETPTNQWNLLWRDDYIHSMMASIYAWKAVSGAAETTDWENVYKYATLSVGNRTLTNNSKVLSDIFNSGTGVSANLSDNDELVVRLSIASASPGIVNFADTYHKKDFVDENDVSVFYKKYDSNDIRKSAYFRENGTFNKYSTTGPGGAVVLYRLADMVLLQAEAKARMDNEGEASRHLNEFITARYNGNTPSQTGTVLESILYQRRLEFFHELDYRWLDMKRLGVSMGRIVSGERVTLESNDFRYTFPIPRVEMNNNRNMIQNPGWENITLD